MKKLFLLGVLIFINCGFNDIQVLDEQIKSDMAEILNQYKRRADLIPSLVKIVERYASHEKEIFIEIAKARSSVSNFKPTPELLNDSKKVKDFQEIQTNLSSSIQRLLLVSENYPQLKSNEGFRDLQVQLEGTENRIAVARRKYIQSIKEYNILIRKFPTMFTARIFGYQVKSSFETEDESTILKIPTNVSKPPEIEFGK